MEGNLKSKTKLISACGNCYEVVKLIGCGGQGEVYEAVLSSDKKTYALKWYYKNKATDAQKEILENLISRGSPDKAFLWPSEIVKIASSDADNNSFGYIMPLLPDNFKGIVDLMKCRVSPSFNAISRAAFNLTRGFERLHGMGLAYHDISFGNLFFNPDNGDVLICDNDNVSAPSAVQISVNGTPRFMAPEIVRGEASPSRNTDLFSLAVLLFYLFMVHHPLEGSAESDIKALDVYAMEKLYGTNPVFIFDPDNDTNRPVKGFHDNAVIYWSLYPKQIKDLFAYSFTSGIKLPAKRVTERQWMDAIVNMLFGIMQCNCGNEVFYDDDAAQTGSTITCWGCRQELPSPLKLVFDSDKKKRVLLLRNTKLCSHYVNGEYDLQTVVGSIVRNPKNPNLWGIRNESDSNWTYIGNDGASAVVEPGKSALIALGAKIDFGGRAGTFV